MKILWLCNVGLPKIINALNINKTIGGGWIEGLSNELVKCNDINLVICFPSNISDSYIDGEIDGISYVIFNENKANIRLFASILEKVSPDIIHIFGTEKKHSLDMIRACLIKEKIEKTIISIQGLVSIYAKHYYAGLPYKIINKWTLRDLIKFSNIKQRKKRFETLGRSELESIKTVKHIIGRTDWDFACTKQINHGINYHFCNESLREAFYSNEWSYDNCVKGRIFVSQCSNPIKGFHFLLEAMPEILSINPDAHIYTTGPDIINSNFINTLKLTSYRWYLINLIKKYQLQDKITFLGYLSEQEMVEQYKSSNVFVSPSSIENSPNSLGEAMILGVPSVSSDVGGVKNMMVHGEEGFLYPFDEPYMLAHYVNKILSNPEIANRLSLRSKIHAHKTHDRVVNNNTLISIYKYLIHNK